MAFSLYVPAQAVSLFILALSITILGLTTNNIVYYNSSKSSKVALKSSNTAVPLFPSSIDITSGGVWALFATGIGGTVDSLLLLGLLYYYQERKDTVAKRSRWIYHTMLFICFVSIVRSTTAMAYAFHEYSKSSSPMSSEGESYLIDMNGRGRIALEKWNRSIAEYLVDGGKQDSVAQQMTAARVLSVLVFVAYLIETAMSLWMWREHRRSAREAKNARVSLTSKAWISRKKYHTVIQGMVTLRHVTTKVKKKLIAGYLAGTSGSRKHEAFNRVIKRKAGNYLQ